MTKLQAAEAEALEADRWTLSTFSARLRGVAIGTYDDWFPHIEDEFDLKREQVDELFERDGCGGATTGKEAAAYIRDFVRREEAATYICGLRVT